MEKIKFKQTNIENWKQIEKLEKDSATPFYLCCEGEDGYKKFIKESTVYVIEKEEKAIGIISHKTLDDGNILINSLAVLPDYRGKGIATTSLQKLINDLGNQTFVLYTHPQNTPALLVYLRLGFVIKEWVDNFYQSGQPRLFLCRQSK